ncbi:hypothetical protein Bca4012_037122 [Brassica carinata]
MEGNILEVCKRVDSIEGSVLGLVQSVFPKFKEEMLQSVKNLVAQLTKNKEAGPSRVPEKDTEIGSRENRSPRISLGENVGPTKDKEVLDTDGGDDDVLTRVLHFLLKARTIIGEKRVHRPFIDMPSFSLGLTQEEQPLVGNGISLMDSVGGVALPTLNAGDNIEDPQQSRKSKRQKCVPQALVDDYQCGREIISRVRKSQKFIFVFDGRHEIGRKYARLLEQVNQNGYFKVAGLAVSGKDIILIAERSKFLTAKVVDLLIRVAKGSIEKHFHADFSARDVYLDSKYVSEILRTYPRFSKSRKKESFRFPKGLVQLFDDKHDSNHQSIRLSGLDFGSDETKPFAFERPKGVSQTANPCDSGLMAVLLMATHAVYGIEACKYINTQILMEEGKSAAIMAMELQDNV